MYVYMYMYVCVCVYIYIYICGAFHVAQKVKNLPAVRETWVQSLGWEDPPREGNNYSLQNSGLQNSTDCTVHGVTKSGTRLSDFKRE